MKNAYTFPCDASTPAGVLLSHIAPNPRAALVVIDSKVDSGMGEPKLRTAGTQVIKFLEEYLFAKGFAGRVRRVQDRHLRLRLP